MIGDAVVVDGGRLSITLFHKILSQYIGIQWQLRLQGHGINSHFSFQALINCFLVHQREVSKATS